MQSNHHLKFRNIINHLYEEGGIRRFWKGSSVIATGCVPAHASYFTVYEYIKKHTGVENSGFQVLASGVTGACSTFFHDIVITPYDGKSINIITFKNIFHYAQHKNIFHINHNSY